MNGDPILDAVETFRDEVRRWAARIGVEAREIRVRPMKRKWASASTAGRLTFNVDLLQEPRDRQAEVIVHELVHLKVGNHGPLFRNLLRAHLTEGGVHKSLVPSVDQRDLNT